jgi:hypothetical protein
MPISLAQVAFFLLSQLAFWALCIALLIWGVRRVSRGDKIGRMFVVIGLWPLVYYLGLTVYSHIVPTLNASYIAALPRKPVTPENLPTIIVQQGSNPLIVRDLISLGPFDTAYGEDWRHPNTWYLYERRRGSNCPATSEVPPRTDDPLFSTDCISAAKSLPPDIRRPYLRLLIDKAATLRHQRSNPNNSPGNANELRWSDNAGGVLIAYAMYPIFDVPLFPPLLLPNGFARADLYGQPIGDPGLETRQFVLHAIGAAK